MVYTPKEIAIAEKLCVLSERTSFPFQVGILDGLEDVPFEANNYPVGSRSFHDRNRGWKQGHAFRKNEPEKEKGKPIQHAAA